MKSLRANVSLVESGERRGERRWHVELVVTLRPEAGSRFASVRNLSETGMMLETDLGLTLGEIVHVELPGGHETDARILWRQDQAFGCQFKTRIPTAVISAALLQAPTGSPGDSDQRVGFEEFPIGIRPSVDELADWKERFEKTHGAAGYRLIAFRQTDGGLLIAIVAPGEKS